MSSPKQPVKFNLTIFVAYLLIIIGGILNGIAILGLSLNLSQIPPFIKITETKLRLSSIAILLIGLTLTKVGLDMKTEGDTLEVLFDKEKREERKLRKKEEESAVGILSNQGSRAQSINPDFSASNSSRLSTRRNTIV